MFVMTKPYSQVDEDTPQLVRVLTAGAEPHDHAGEHWRISPVKAKVQLIFQRHYAPLELEATLACTTCGLPEVVQAEVGELPSSPLEEGTRKHPGRLPTRSEVLENITADAVRQIEFPGFAETQAVTVTDSERDALRGELDVVLRAAEESNPGYAATLWTS